MAKKEPLFDLIKSMSRSEKRYFTLMAGRENAVYLRLFQAVEKMDAYDEKKIKRKFRNEKFTNQLHVAKNYLSAFVLRCLRNYHASASIRSQILDLLQEVEILLGRELYHQCEKTLIKAEKLALQYEYTTLHLDVLGARRRLLLARGGSQRDGLLEIANREHELLAQAQYANQIWGLTADLFRHASDKEFLKNPLIKEKPLAASLRTETLRRHMRYSWYFVNGQRAKAEREVNTLITLQEQRPQQIAEEPGAYVTALGNKISMLLGEKRWEETEKLLAEMRQVPERFNIKKNSRFALRLWLRLYNLELEFLRDAGRTQRALKLAAEIEGFLASHHAAVPLNYVLLFRFQFALIHLEAKDFHGALREINIVLNGDFGNERTDLQCAARLLNLVIHFELGNILVLRYVVDSAQRFLAKHKSLGHDEKVLLTLFKKLSRAGKKEYKQMFLQTNLDLTGRGDVGYFDFRQWIMEKAG